MPEIIKSNNIEWLEISEKLYTGKYIGLCTKFEYSLNKCLAASQLVLSDEMISDLSLPVTIDEVEELNEKRRKLVSFANGIHYEISQLVDNPFSLAMGQLAEAAYDLDPSDIQVDIGCVGEVDFNVSLKDLICSGLEDEQLKKDFETKAGALDNDVVPHELEQAILEAKFWEKEYGKTIQCGEIANTIFTPEVCEQWPTMTTEERWEYINIYKNEIGVILGEGVNITPQDVDLCKGDNGYSSASNGIKINENFIYNPTGNYSIDKMIDTTTHEMRHQYQNAAKNNPEKYGVPDAVYSEWTQTYIEKNPEFTKYYQQPIEEDAKAYAALSRLCY